MVENILKALCPCLVERLGKVYSYSNEYKQNLEKETELAEELKNTLSREQMELMKKYQTIFRSL